MNINEYMRNYRYDTAPHQVKRIICKDGFTMSVQASKYTYCTPRVDNASHYTHVEVGFPSRAPLFFAEYAEDSERYTDTVYGYVPVELVEKEIAAHGGIVFYVE